MARRIHANLDGGSDSNNFSSDNYQNDSHEYQNDQNYAQQSYGYSQENFEHQANFGYQSHQTGTNPGSASHNDGNPFAYAPNYSNDYSYGSNTAAFVNGGPNNNLHSVPNSAPHASFPPVNHSPLVQQSSKPSHYGSHNSYTPSNSEKSKSWISAFSSGGFENEPPLMEGTN